ncbi:MAG: acid phosphatase [Acidimicrobiales bacterium]|nr:acid phosphatase [Acidimicrobiales bacterium]
MAHRQKLGIGVGLTLVAAAGAMTLPQHVAASAPAEARGLGAVEHIVVIYEENHSFDNLFGMWPGVNGLNNADYQHTVQVGTDGRPLACLPQNDVNLTSPSPLPTRCTDSSVPAPVMQSAFTNAPFKIEDYIAPTDVTCPKPGTPFAPNGLPKNDPNAAPGGCTKDLVHRFYQEQYQINGGQMNRYTTGSDAIGLTQGHYDTTQLPIYKFLTAPNAPKFVIADNFFQAAFGGSFLNHQWLIAAQSPVYAGADHSGTATDLHSVLGTDLNPNTYPLHPSTGGKDSALTVDTNPGGSCKSPLTTACGDYAVNTIQPTYPPFSSPSAAKLPPLTSGNIGDSLSAANVDWAWYAGGWSNANGLTTAPGWTNGPGPTCTAPNVSPTATYPNCVDALFQFHHQPFNYFANYAPGTAARAAHLKDEAEFIAAAASGDLKPVSFVKPVGEENEHPGYASTALGEDHLVALINAIRNGPDGPSTAIVVTYDEFGGQWDHVPPPTAPGVSDKWGPGTRIPALIISPLLQTTGVDHTQYDTTSILATIESRFGLAPLSSRDAAVNDFSGDFAELPANAAQFLPLTPTRIFDTRPTSLVGYTGAKPAADVNLRVAVTGVGGVPAGATAAVVNITATEAGGPGYVQAFPTGAGTPGASSNLNIERVGQTIANSAIVPIGADGSITLHTQQSTHLIVDVAGYYKPVTGPVDDGRLVPVTPTRIFDTRPTSAVNYSGAKPAAGSTTRVAVTGRGSVPTSGVEAAVLNVTATDSSGIGYVQVAPAGQLTPGASSSLNLESVGQTRPSQVIVPLGTNGAVDIYTQSGTHLIVDIAGYITGDSPTSSISGLFVPLTPGRLLDTRSTSRVGYVGGTPAANATVTVATAGRLGLPQQAIGAVAANITITESAAPGFVQAAPAGQLSPGASSVLNAETVGQTIANAAIVPVSDQGFDLYTQSGGELLADVSGWFTR